MILNRSILDFHLNMDIEFGFCKIVKFLIFWSRPLRRKPEIPYFLDSLFYVKHCISNSLLSIPHP